MNELAQPLENMDWLFPTEIQSEAIPLILGGGDILMAAETGTGKTGAFCIPIVQVVFEHLNEKIKAKQMSCDMPKKVGQPENNVHWTLNPADRAQDLVLDNELLTAQSKSGSWQGCRTNKGIKRSKNRQNLNSRVYYEVHFAEQGLARVGWSFANASFDLGTDRNGWGYGGTAKKSHNRQFDDYGLNFGEKFDIIGCILDLKTSELSFTKNGRFLGVAFKIGNQNLESRELYPTLCVKNAGCRSRFGPDQSKNDHKPDNCIWISEADSAQIVNGRSNTHSGASQNTKGPLAIIIEPSRELAKQTFDFIELFAKNLGIKSALWVGGNNEGQSDDMGNAHILVCTLGRLASALSKDQLPLNNVHFFILDEADELLQQGNRNLILNTYGRLPKMFDSGRRLQVICCSATLHNFEVKQMSQQLMYFPIWIDLKGEDSVPDTVHHVVFKVNPKLDQTYMDLDGLFETDGVHSNDRLNLFNKSKEKQMLTKEEFSEAIKLMKFYYALKAIETIKMDQGIIFCRTKLDCDNLDEFMQDMNRRSNSDKYSAVRLHSSLSQRERDQNLANFKAKKVRFLICTDVAARGLDIRGVPFVIQVTLPEEKNNYIHRIGRVGRADRMGLALSLIGTEQEKVWYHKCNKKDCPNTSLLEHGGCCKWQDEIALLGDIEDHLKCTIQDIDRDFKLSIDEYDGKVVYGAKRLQQTLTYEGHVEQLKSIVTDLCDLEYKAQEDYITWYL